MSINFDLSRMSRVTTCDTPIAIFVSHLLSLGHTGQEVAEIVRLAEAAFRTSTSKTIENKREKDRLRQAAWRANRDVKRPVLSQNVTRDMRDTSHDSILSLEVTKTLNPIKKKESKKGKRENTRASVTPVTRDKVGQNTAEQVDDGWPDNYLEIFWYKFPVYRRQAKSKVGEKLARLRRDKKIDWPTLIDAVAKFAATNPGEYAPAPMVWLNDGRWDREYGATPPKNGKAGFFEIAVGIDR